MDNGKEKGNYYNRFQGLHGGVLGTQEISGNNQRACGGDFGEAPSFGHDALRHSGSGLLGLPFNGFVL